MSDIYEFMQGDDRLFQATPIIREPGVDELSGEVTSGEVGSWDFVVPTNSKSARPESYLPVRPDTKIADGIDQLG